MDGILKLINVSLTYQSEIGETQAIKNLNLTVKKGEFIAIIGPSGCGKTTLLSMIAGLLPPTSGEIRLLDEKIIKPNKNVGYMLQRDELFPWRTIQNNAYLPLEIKKINTPYYRNQVKNLLEKYGLKDFLKAYPSEISGGMRQRVALIRTLAGNPDLLLLDEPFSALDYQTRIAVCNDVYKIITTEEKTAILVTHDISEALSMADRVIVLSKRPATIFKEHEYSLDKSMLPLKRREDKDFGKKFETLWRELNYE
ncbi:MAG: ABC transporter ATP-binding protein [Clostridia bacterium]|nr:ABC transporter ATP-binding protein [Clostridia bacterium]